MFPLRTDLILTIALLATVTPTPTQAPDDGFVSIFDGKTMAGWEGDAKYWRVEDGALTGETTADNPTKGNTFLLWQLGELDDFELQLRYRIRNGNSGIQYRSEHLGNYRVKGYQADFEAGDRWSGILYHERGRGILAERGEKTVVHDRGERDVENKFGDGAALQAKIKKGDWNTYRITARGRHLVHSINGQVMSECTDEGQGQYRPSGILALQLHAGPPMKVQFKDILLKRLPLEDAVKIVFVAGHKSHGYGAHEHVAGSKLLAGRLNEHVAGVLATVYTEDWPRDPTAFDNANALVLYMNGGEGHPVNAHLDEVAKLMKRGGGLACLHYAVEVPKGPSGDAFLDWIGGHFETHWSVNPHWTADFTALPEHPITRGVKPFSINDEWYYHMRFRPEMAGVTALLTAVPPDTTRARDDGPHSNNPTVRSRKGMPEHVAWAREREDGGRGFGFTGGHFHKCWAHDDYRMLVLNALLWVAGAEVPERGAVTPTPTVAELEANQDYPKPGNYDAEKLRAQIEEWNSK